MRKLTHFNQHGEAYMVDVGTKDNTHRVAIAEGLIKMHADTLKLIVEVSHKKGDVLGIARVAGIMAAKKTSELIPLCHPLLLSHIDIQLDADTEDNSVRCQVKAETNGQTGVEMEALTAVQITLLTIYDMCKAVDKGMTIEKVSLVEKSDSKSNL